MKGPNVAITCARPTPCRKIVMQMKSGSWSNIRFDYAGCHVLVTGGTSGIGAGIAAAYGEAGARVTITGTRPSASDYDIDLSSYGYRQLRVIDDSQIAAVAESLPELDILVLNAGAALAGGGVDEYEPDVFDLALRINLSSAYRLASACREKLARSGLPGGASVIGIASMTSFFGNEVVPGYGAAKAGLVQLTKSLGIHWAAENIRVNAVAVGLTETRMTAAHVADMEALAPYLTRTPLARVGQPRDVAGAVLFLTSAAASFITGQTLPVDGGYSIVG